MGERRGAKKMNRVYDFLREGPKFPILMIACVLLLSIFIDPKYDKQKAEILSRPPCEVRLKKGEYFDIRDYISNEGNYLVGDRNWLEEDFYELNPFARIVESSTVSPTLDEEVFKLRDTNYDEEIEIKTPKLDNLEFFAGDNSKSFKCRGLEKEVGK